MAVSVAEGRVASAMQPTDEPDPAEHKRAGDAMMAAALAKLKAMGVDDLEVPSF